MKDLLRPGQVVGKVDGDGDIKPTRVVYHQEEGKLLDTGQALVKLPEAVQLAFPELAERLDPGGEEDSSVKPIKSTSERPNPKNFVERPRLFP